MLVRNYDPPSYSLTGMRCRLHRATREAKNLHQKFFRVHQHYKIATLYQGFKRTLSDYSCRRHFHLKISLACVSSELCICKLVILEWQVWLWWYQLRACLRPWSLQSRALNPDIAIVHTTAMIADVDMLQTSQNTQCNISDENTKLNKCMCDFVVWSNQFQI